MPGAAGNCRFSQPEICSGDHWSTSFCATRHRSSAWRARRQGFGRKPRRRARLPASLARWALQPPLRLISRLTVEGDRSRPCAIRRIDRPAAMPREISSRSSSRSAPKALRRGAGAILKRSRDVRHTLTALPALPQLSLLFRRDPCPCMPLHSHTSSSAKIRRCCVDSLNSPPKADKGRTVIPQRSRLLPYSIAYYPLVALGQRPVVAEMTFSSDSDGRQQSAELEQR